MGGSQQLLRVQVIKRLVWSARRAAAGRAVLRNGVGERAAGSRAGSVRGRAHDKLSFAKLTDARFVHSASALQAQEAEIEKLETKIAALRAAAEDVAAAAAAGGGGCVAKL